MDNYFANIGKKIMTLAKVLTVIITTIGVILGIVLMSNGYEEAVLGGLGIIIASPFVAYLCSMTLYGFGKLIDSAEKIEKKMNGTTETILPEVSEELPEI